MSTEYPPVADLRPERSREAALSRPVGPWRGRSSWWAIAAVLACIAFMLPTLFYPMGPDGAMFAAGGRRLLQGALYYRDLVDVKPPLIFYAYAIVQALFGGSDIAIRAADAVLQLGVALGLYLLAHRRGGERWGAIAAILYCFLYSALGYQSTAQTESLGAALGLAAFGLTTRPHRARGAFAAGAIVGVAALVKTTFLAMLPALVLVELIRPDEARGTVARNIVAECAGSALILLLFAAAVLGNGLGHDFALQQQFTRAFVLVHLLNPAEMLARLTTDLAGAIGETLSLPVALAAAIAASAAARASAHRISDRQRDILRHATVWLLMLFVSIIVESRFHPYHFIRLMPFAVLLAAWVFRRRDSREAETVRTSGLVPFRAFLVVTLCALSLVMMPFARWAWYALPSVWYATGQARSYESYYSRATDGYAFREHREVAAMIRERRLHDGELFVASGVASYIYNASGVSPSIPFLHSSFYVAPWAPVEWRDRIARDFRHRPPKMLVLAHDTHEDLNGSSVTSEQGLRSIPGVDAIIRDRYRLIGRTESFGVYELGTGARGE